MWKAGENSPIWKTVKHLVEDIENINNRFKNLQIENKGEISPDELKIAVSGQNNQGEYLVGSKFKQNQRK